MTVTLRTLIVIPAADKDDANAHFPSGDVHFTVPLFDINGPGPIFGQPDTRTPLAYLCSTILDEPDHAAMEVYMSTVPGPFSGWWDYTDPNFPNSQFLALGLKR